MSPGMRRQNGRGDQNTGKWRNSKRSCRTGTCHGGDVCSQEVLLKAEAEELIRMLDPEKAAACGDETETEGLSL